jgi:uncharacterized LabA/DUF88 family protein
MTDVNIATSMLIDAFRDRFDVALMVTGDSDLVPPLRASRDMFPAKRIIVAFPPDRQNAVLKQVAHATIALGRALLAKSQFPDQVVRGDGYVLQRPAKWR